MKLIFLVISSINLEKVQNSNFQGKAINPDSTQYHGIRSKPYALTLTYLLTDFGQALARWLEFMGILIYLCLLDFVVALRNQNLRQRRVSVRS